MFSREMLLQLIAMGADVQGVCTAAEATSNSDYADLAPICLVNGIPVWRTTDINSTATLAWIRGRAPDVIFCFGWSRLLSRELLTIPPRGVVGYHPAQLPANRGRHPLIWALVLGLESTASTFFVMDEGADSGDILSQVTIAIATTDDAGVLYRKVINSARDQLAELVPLLAKGRVQGVKQDPAQSSSWRKRSAVDGRIDWRMPARGIYNLVRALARPYPGAEILTENGPVKVWKTEIVQGAPANAEPGKVLRLVGGKPVVRCGEESICLVEFEPDFPITPGAYL